MLVPCRVPELSRQASLRALRRERQKHAPGDGGAPHPRGRQAGQCRLAQRPQRTWSTGSRGSTLFEGRQREGDGWAGGQAERDPEGRGPLETKSSAALKPSRIERQRRCRNQQGCQAQLAYNTGEPLNQQERPTIFIESKT